MTFKVRVTQEAYDDIKRNANWWAAHHSVEQAERWSDAILEKIQTLADFPESHVLAYESADYEYDLREALFGLESRPSYRILFTIVNDIVWVLGVRAAEQNDLRPGDLPSPPPRDD
jgi:plasmid stabilization system protein ParE